MRVDGDNDDEMAEQNQQPVFEENGGGGIDLFNKRREDEDQSQRRKLRNKIQTQVGQASSKGFSLIPNKHRQEPSLWMVINVCVHSTYCVGKECTSCTSCGTTTRVGYLFASYIVSRARLLGHTVHGT